MHYTNSSVFIIKIQGNLGSQLWQYAFGQFLQKKHNKKVIYDIAAFSKQNTNSFLLPKILSHKITTITSSKNIFWKYKLKKYNYFKEKYPFTYDKKTLTTKDNTIFDGYFQHPSYLKPIEQELHNSIKKNSLPKKYTSLQKTHTLVALHIYRENKNNTYEGLQGNCDLAYYYQALEKVQKNVKNPYVLIFTNDIDWTKKNFTPSCKHEYITHNKNSHKQIIHDFFLMQMCEHFIISNSSFSYWAAYFGSTKKSQIIAPYFFNYEHNTISKKTVFPSWHVLAHTFCSKKIKPKISIIIPVYNVEKYLSRCLESACNQSLKEIEIIVVNDCTPDNSEKIILQYMKRDSRIKYIKHKKNLGLGGARNTGIKNTNADWLVFLDSDDWIHQDTAKVTLEKALKHKVQVVQYGIIGTSDQGKKAYQYSSPITKNKEINNAFHHYCNSFYPFIFPASWGKLWHKDLFIKNKIVFPNHIPYEDLPTTALLLYHAKKILLTTDYFAFYLTDRTSSIMNKISINNIKAHSIIQKHILSYLKPLFLKDKTLEENVNVFLINSILGTYSRLQTFINKDILLKFYEHTKEYGILAMHKYYQKNTQLQNQKIQTLYANYWYQFGQLSKKQKIIKIIQLIKRKLLYYLTRANTNK